MKLLIVILLTLVITVALSLWAMKDPGYLLIAVGPWTVETTLTLAIVVVLLAFATGYYSIRLLSRLHKLPADVRFWRRQRRERKSQRALTQGLIELAEGQWPAAERHAIKFASQGPSPLLNYLAAARAAQAQGADDRRDQYLKLAFESHPSADIAVGLTQAELQIKQHQLEQALATLRHLHQIAPKHVQVLKALVMLYRELEDWEHLLELMPALHKRKVMSESELSELSRHAYISLLGKADGKNLNHVWHRIPRHEQEDNQVLKTYVERLIAVEESDLAEPLIRHALKRQAEESLLRLYGLINASDPARQLSLVESLLEEEENHNAVTLLTAGRLCLRNKLWGKARSYLEASVNLRPSAEAYHELGNLLEQLGEHEAAAECFRSGLALTPGCEYSVPITVSRTSMLQELQEPDTDHYGKMPGPETKKLLS